MLLCLNRIPLAAVFLVTLAMIALAGCGGESSQPGVVGFPVNPTISAGKSITLNAQVVNSSNTGVVFKVRARTDGNTPGTISQNGTDPTATYTAPAVVPNNFVDKVDITTTDGRASTTINITVSLNAVVIPQTLDLSVNRTYKFTAQVPGDPNNSVTWSIVGVGSIDQTGLYTAPVAAPNGTTVTVTATSNVSGTQATAIITLKSGSETITITP